MKNFEVTIWRTEQDNNPWIYNVKAVTAEEAKDFATSRYYEIEGGSIWDTLITEM